MTEFKLKPESSEPLTSEAGTAQSFLTSEPGPPLSPQLRTPHLRDVWELKPNLMRGPPETPGISIPQHVCIGPEQGQRCVWFC